MTFYVIDENIKGLHPPPVSPEFWKNYKIGPEEKGGGGGADLSPRFPLWQLLCGPCFTNKENSLLVQFYYIITKYSRKHAAYDNTSHFKAKEYSSYMSY